MLQKLLRIKLPQQQQQQQKKEQQQPRELQEAEHQQVISGDSQGEDMQTHTYGNSPIDKLLQGNGEIMLFILIKFSCVYYNRSREVEVSLALISDEFRLTLPFFSFKITLTIFAGMVGS